MVRPGVPEVSGLGFRFISALRVPKITLPGAKRKVFDLKCRCSGHRGDAGPGHPSCSLLLQDGHFSTAQLGWLWSAADRCNPVAALRKALRRARIAGDLHCWRSGRETLERPLFAEAQVREAWLQRAQCRCDMAKVAAGRPKLRLGEQAIQWGWIRGQVARVHLSADRLAALIGVMAGDAVPELTAMKWQKNRTGLCSCGEPEDLRHR